MTQILRNYGYNKLFHDNYRRYLVGDTYILFLIIIFYPENSLGFVLQKILVAQT